MKKLKFFFYNVHVLQKPRNNNNNNQQNNMNYSAIVAAMRQELQAKTLLKAQLQQAGSLTEKFILLRRAVNPQSTVPESVIMDDMNIGRPLDETSGDGHKNGINYELKFSLHTKNGGFNFVQIRPDHTIDYYLVGGYNLFEGEIGKAYICKVPADVIYRLIPEYGGYAHGTVSKLGKITCDNIKGRNCEYALRPNPNAKEGTKPKRLWNELLKYEVEYHSDNF